MAYLKPQTPLKDLNSGDYFYPLTTIDQIITGTSRLSAFLSEDNSNHNLLNLSNIGNLSVNGTTYIDGQLTIAGGMKWPAPQNITATATANGQEWSIDLNPGSYTGTYFHIWSSTNGNSIAQFWNDNRHVIIPVHLAVGGYNNTSYGLSCNSFICNSWIRTVGANGWYNESYGGGWYMSDNDWLRSYNNKSVYTGSGTIRTDNQLQVGDSGNKFYANSSGNGYFSNTLGIAGTNTSYKLYVNGSTYLGGTVNIASTLYAPVDKNFMCHGNEHNFIPDAYSSDCYFNYDTVTRKGNGNITAYRFCNGKHGLTNGYFAKVYGAVWNDYAEFRKGNINNFKSGQVVTENGDGTMRLADKELMKACKILSDTYGMAIGENEENKLPIAVSGRVLVYCDTPKEELEVGDFVCSNYTGNVRKMTKEEIINYPESIIGSISEFPTYEIWNGGNYLIEQKGAKEKIIEQQTEIKVDGRIWVYVK